jgi:hypothetical protein
MPSAVCHWLGMRISKESYQRGHMDFSIKTI